MTLQATMPKSKSVVGLDEGLAVGAAVVGLDEGLAFYAQHNVQCVQSRWQFTLL